MNLTSLQNIRLEKHRAKGHGMDRCPSQGNEREEWTDPGVLDC